MLVHTTHHTALLPGSERFACEVIDAGFKTILDES